MPGLLTSSCNVRILFAGVVDGHNIWANDLAASVTVIEEMQHALGKENVVSTSCSLLHTAVDLKNETKLDADLKSWLAFTAQKISLLPMLLHMLPGGLLQGCTTGLFKRLITEQDYEKAINAEIDSVVKLQEELDVDVLVHGEPEYAQSVTKRPMKGMLTGPVTILNWSFVRNDQTRSETCYQIALAIKDEVEDLQAGGINVTQIDEAALQEGLPLCKSEQADHQNWALHGFRITTSGVMDTTQYGAGIGPGVYDIHSPRIPSTEEMAEHACKMLAVLESKVLWINPDCGLKTRKYTEVAAALTNMVNAAKQLWTELAK
ncbi:unnamed protein product [Sphagnum troendelagicum]|uniref:Cobalamin-independent methionine synthase MetE C-terminal/archaeal domain-containing protein n=1 Tax=Sphagnum troendelagicum TaxID=128251 RepID=A0ABP0UIV7_9BRYO